MIGGLTTVSEYNQLVVISTIATTVTALLRADPNHCGSLQARSIEREFIYSCKIVGLK